MGTDTARSTSPSKTRRILVACLLVLLTLGLVGGIVWWTRRPATLRVVSRLPIAGKAPMLAGPDGYLAADTARRFVYRDWTGSVRWTAELDGKADDLTAMSLSPDGRTLALATREKTETAFRLWHDGEPVRTVKLPTPAQHDVQVTDDGALFAWIGRPRARRTLLHAWTPAGAHLEAECTVVPEGPEDLIAQMDLSPDGTQVLLHTAKGSLGAAVRLGEKTLTVDPKAGPRILDPTPYPVSRAWPLGEGRAVTEKGVLYTDGAKVTLPGTWNVSSSWDGRHIIAWTDREATVATAAGDIAWTVPGVWADGGTLASGGGAFVAAIRRTDPPVVLRAVRDIAPGLANRLWGPGGDTTLAVCTAPGRVAASTPVGADGFQVHLIDGRDRAMLVGRAISADGHTVVAQCIVAGTGKYEIWVLRW